jgi:hypothetical protein
MSPFSGARSFVGRTREFAVLADRLQAARRGRGALCLVTGEAGIGKSRLIGEFAAQCTQLGIPVHFGMAWEAGGAPAYWPWIQVLRSVCSGEGGRAALAELAHRAAPLAQLVPELVGPLGAAPRLEPEQARFQLMDAVASALSAAAHRAPIVITLEDLHAADPDSLLLLDFVARQLRNAQAMLVASWREAELQRTQSPALLARLRRQATEVRLTRLDREAVREYVRAASVERPLEQTITELCARTEGHPLYLAEVVELGLARGSFAATPATLTSAILERLAGLPSRTRALVGVASVLGREVPLPALAELAGEASQDLETTLAPALAARLLEPAGEECLRFEHALVREAVHDALPGGERRRLHARRAAAMEREAERDETRWSELALHLAECSPDARERAVEAWRRAAAQADARQAFDDAALCAARALEASGANAAPARRATLLLELAAAQTRAGDVDTGQRNSHEAYVIGESLRDGALMTDAALTYGSVFTFAQVDPILVQLLRRALEALPETDHGRRARLLARLAAAMQPAADPDEPIALAREAIALARRSGDAPTLLTTLRSAISALMDLSDPAERLALNREHVQLAQNLGDVSEQVRGYTRMIVDALELGDAATMDYAIAQVELLAQRLGLPQYLWSAASFRVMRATMRGELAAAEVALQEAQALAERTQDPNARRTLAVQRLGVAEARERPDLLLERLTQLEALLTELALADTFIRPQLLAMRARAGRVDTVRNAIDADLLARVVRFHDMGTFCGTAELLAAAGERALAAQLYERMLPYAERCGHWGLFGRLWAGPIARGLALLAVRLERRSEADRHFEAALRIARGMQARQWVARIAIEWADSLLERTDATSRTRGRALLDEALAIARPLELQALLARAESIESRSAAAEGSASVARAPDAGISEPVSSGVPALAYFRIERDGELWRCECEGVSFRLRDTRGLQMLARLVAKPHSELHVLDLAAGSAEDAPIDVGDAGEVLDARARREYQARLRQLREEIEEAESLGDGERAAAAREEIEQLGSELARAFGLGGRTRRTGAAAERARVNVQRRLKDAIARIGRECPTAGRHLEWAVKTGAFCSYRPG